jgi:membrane-associated phospholipid phosphatase
VSFGKAGGKAYIKLQLTSRRTLRLIASAAALWGAAVLVWAQGGMDKAVQIAHNPLREVPFLTGAARALSTYGMAFCVLVYLVMLALSFKFDGLKDVRKVYPLVLLSFAFAGIAGDLSKGIFGRPRPFVRYAGEISPVIRPGSGSIPSGHATKAFALILPFLVFAAGKKKWRTPVKVFFLFAASAIAYSRIVLGVHYLSDVLAGIGTALLFLPIAAVAANAIYKKMRLTEAGLGRLAGACGLVMLVLIYYLIHYS